MDTKIYWLKQDEGGHWGSLYPQFYIYECGAVDGKYCLSYIRNPNVKPRYYYANTIQKLKRFAKALMDEIIGGN